MSTFKQVGVYAAITLAVTSAGMQSIRVRESPGGVPPTTAYLDPAGVPTICHGRIQGVKLGMQVTPAQCERWLSEEVLEYSKAVQQYIQQPITPKQFDILVDFTYNKGKYALRDSTLRRKINAGDCYGAAQEFARWQYATRYVRGKPVKVKLPGLVKAASTWATQFRGECQ